VSARDAICLELQLGGGTRYYANTALHEPATYWAPRLLPDEDIVRSTDPHEGYLAALGVTVRLDNTDGVISDLLDSDTIDGATALIYRKVVSNAGVVTSTTTRLKGKCRYVGGDQLAVRIEIMPPAITDLDYFQRKINATAFPTAPDGAVAGKPSTLGLGMTAPFGYCTNSKGKVELIMINDTPNAEKFGGIMGGVFDFSAVYRERADVLTLLAVTTHYTKTLYALDAEGNSHAFITLTSGTWAEGDRYFANIKGLPKDYYVTADGSADHLSRANADLSSDFPGKAAVSAAFTREIKAYPTNITAGNYALDVDGSTEYATAATVGITGDFTIEARIKLGTTGIAQIIFAQRAAAEGFGFSVLPGNQAYIGLKTDADAEWYTYSTITLAAATWYKIKASHNNTTHTLKLTIDNTDRTAAPVGTPEAYNISTTTVGMGAYGGGGTKFNGQIDYIKLNYTYDSSTNDISNPVHTWTFDAQNLNDSVGAYHFTGVNIDVDDYVYLGGAADDQALEAVWKTATNDRSWKMLMEGTTGKLRLYLSSDGTAEYYAQTSGALTISTAAVVRYGWSPTAGVFVQINGVTQDLTTSGSLPTTLYASAADYTVGADGAYAQKFKGRLYDYLWAEGTQQLTGSNTCDRDQPLEDIRGEWPFSGIARVNDAGAYYVRDRVGNNHLTATSLTQADITLATYETSGPWMLDRALRWNDYNWQLASDLISRTSLGVLLTAFEAAGYNDASGTWFAGMLPPDPGMVMETSAVLREFCWALGCVPYVTPEGQLAFVDFDATSEPETANVYAEQLGQIVDARLGAPLPKWNECPRVLFDRLHRNDGSWGSSAVATNQESIDNYGLAEEDAEFALIGNINYLAPLIGRHMLKRSGRPATATIELAGYDAWVEDIGSKPQFSLPNMRGSWQERSLLLYQVEDGIWDYKPKLTGIECGAQCGSIVVTAKGAVVQDETGATVLMTADTFIGKSDNGVHIDAHNVTAYGTLTYLRHGHHYGNPATCFCVPQEPSIYIGEFTAEDAEVWVAYHYWGVPMWKHIAKGYNNGDWRSLLRASFAAHAGKTIDTVKLRLYVIEKPSLEWKFNISYAELLFRYFDTTYEIFRYLDGYYTLPSGYQCRSGWSGGAVHRCTDKDWTVASSWYGESWADSKISTQLGTFGSAAGLIYVPLDKTYFQAACSGTADGGGGNEVNLVLEAHSAGDYSQNIKIASSRHATVGYRPALIVTFSG